MSGRTQSRRYPLARVTIARLIPVLPLVGSRMVLSDDRSPLSSAAPIIYSAMRSFTLPVGFWPSSLAYISTPDFGEKRARRTSGVLPTASRMEAKGICVSPVSTDPHLAADAPLRPVDARVARTRGSLQDVRR